MRTALERVTATGGFLERADVRLRPGLNCIIGSRGTCKSTLVESIRFALNAEPERVAVLLGTGSGGSGFFGMIRDTLGAGSIRCEMRDLCTDTLYSVERDSQSAPRIYREGVKDHTDTRLLHLVEIYSQGDLQRIAEDEQLRLTLIDRPHWTRIEQLRQQRLEVADALREVGPRIRALRAQVAELRTQLRALPELRGQLQEVRLSRPQLSRDLDEQRTLYLQRRSASEAVQKSITARDEAVAAIHTVEQHLCRLQAAQEQLAALDSPGAAAVSQRLREAEVLLTGAVDNASALQDVPLVGEFAALQSTFENLNEPYFALRQQEQEANESLKKEDALRQQIEHLERCEQEAVQLETQLHKLNGQRTECRLRTRRISDEIFQLRAQEVDGINQKHGHFIALTLESGSLSRAYVEEVEQLLQGSRLRGQDEIARDLATLVNPADLIDLVEAGNTQQLAAVLGRDLTQVTRLMSFLIDSPDLYDLEGHVLEDRLNITLFDEGQPKPVQSLSKGQKATALLPLILREAPYPLVFDQPEDDLDNRFIFHSLVQTIRELKHQRQIIFVTHNANIPVIGEADMVIVMQMDSPSRAAPPLHGSVDDRQRDIVDLLEGGAEAFRERQRRYESLLTARSPDDAD